MAISKSRVVIDYINSNADLVDEITLRRVNQGSDSDITVVLWQIHRRSLPKQEKRSIEEGVYAMERGEQHHLNTLLRG